MVKQLYYFITVANLGSITAAADALFVSKQSLSESISRLEKQYNVKLFVRSKNGMQLTDVGCLFYEDAVGIMQRIDVLSQKYASKTIKNECVVRISISTYMTPQIMIPVLEQVKVSAPTIQIRFKEVLQPKDSLNDLITCEADIALFAMEPLFLKGKDSGLENILKYLDTIKVFEDRYCILVNKKFSLSRKKITTYEEYIKFPIVIYEPYKAEYPAVYRGKPTSIDNIFYVNNLNTYRQLINNGLAIGVTTCMLFPELYKQYPNISCVLDMTPNVEKSIILAKTKTRTLTSEGELVWRILLDVLEQVKVDSIKNQKRILDTHGK